MNPEPLSLSVVSCGRNDNHNGDFDWRAEIAIRHNAALLKRYHINYEYIWIEWNPLPGKALFFDKIRKWIPSARCVIVPQAIHRLVCCNPNIGVMQFHAKNAGIRRASEKWVIATNADTYFSEELVRKMAEGGLAEDKCHIAERIDFSSEYLSEPIGEYPIAGLENRTPVHVFSPDFAKHFGAPGDFTMMSRELFSRMQGYYEGIRFSNVHLDTLLCRKLQAEGVGIDTAGVVYHADHADSWLHLEKVGSRHHGGRDYAWQHVLIPYKNSLSWGLMNFKEDKTDEHMVYLIPPADVPPEVKLKISGSLITRDDFFHDIRNQAGQLAESGRRVLLYAPGNDFRQEIPDLLIKRMNIVGVLDDRPSACDGIRQPVCRLEDIGQIEHDAIIVCSWWWCYDVAEKLKRMNLTDKIYPAFLRCTDRMQDVFEL